MTTISEFLGILGLATMLSFSCSMAVAGDVPEGLMSCSAESNDQRRLACYDREMDGLLPAADAAEPSANAAAVEPQPQVISMTALAAAAQSRESVQQGAATGSADRASPSASGTNPVTASAAKARVPDPQLGKSATSGQETQLVQEPEPRNVSPESKEPDELSAIVTEIARQPHGEHLVYLDNGQVWAEQTKSSYFPVDIGDTITIKKRRFKGYRLVTRSGMAYNVKRLR